MKSPALRYHGGKFRLAPWVLGFFPEHQCYVEPFGGAAGVLLQKRRSYAEVYNDLDGDIVNFFRVLRDPELARRLVELCTLTPYAREEFDRAYEATDDPVERARRTAVRAAMGFGSAGATKGTSGFRIDMDRAYATASHLWGRYPDSLAQVGARFLGVMVENRPAVEVLRQYDAPTTLHYCDPPYVLSTRSEGGNRYYRHEMSDEDHSAFLQAVNDLSGMVIVSGYPCALYDEALAGWERHETEARIAANRGTGKRTEALWLNPACAEALRRPRAQADLLTSPETAEL
jgi:DNA adenine methylase